MNTRNCPYTGKVVWKWPETQAFLDRLGVVDIPTTRALDLRVAVDEPVRVTQEYFASENQPDENDNAS